MIVEIRLCHRADGEAGPRIAADTAFSGKPIEAFLPDRRVMQDAIASYDTDCESRSTWIADVDGMVAAAVPETGTGSGRYLTGGISRALTTAGHHRGQFAARQSIRPSRRHRWL